MPLDRWLADLSILLVAKLVDMTPELTEADEQPWHTTIPPCTVHNEVDGIHAELWFPSPETTGWHAGKKCHIYVTWGDHNHQYRQQHVWHMEVDENGMVTISPSIHFIGHFHSPNPVNFRLVTELPSEDHPLL